MESVFTFADQRRDGGVVDRLPDFFAVLFFALELEEDRFVDDFLFEVRVDLVAMALPP